MVRQYPLALLIGFAVGALPWMVANFALLGWIPIEQAQLGLDDEEAIPELARYALWTLTLIMLQTPAAGVMTTLYLGQAVFEEKPTWTTVFREARRQGWRWIWVLGVLRMPIPVMVYLACRWGQAAHPFFDIVVPIAVVIAMTVNRSSRPFMPEILLLEQCPLSGSSDSVITVSRRSKSLHSPVGGDLGGRFLAVAFALFFLSLSLICSVTWFRGITSGVWDWDLWFYLLLLPLSLWVIGGVSVIVRLLNYLDTRIRLEGWEVELAVRAEAMRQFGEESTSRRIPVAGGKSKPPITGSVAGAATQANPTAAADPVAGSPLPGNQRPADSSAVEATP